MDKKKNIVLIGMMGAGKSTIGHLIGEKLSDFFYVDIDLEIEKEAKKHIPEIFAQDGEKYFRNLESIIIKRFCSYHNQVIATGGGIVEKEENLYQMKKNGVLFYLKASPAVLFKRVRKTTNRPLLFHENPQERLEELIKKREKYYQEADFEIDTEEKELIEIVDEILEKYDSTRHFED